VGQTGEKSDQPQHLEPDVSASKLLISYLNFTKPVTSDSVVSAADSKQRQQLN